MIVLNFSVMNYDFILARILHIIDYSFKLKIQIVDLYNSSFINSRKEGRKTSSNKLRHFYPEALPLFCL
jgi:hypothetical protein